MRKREIDMSDTSRLISEFLERGGCINVLKSRPPKYRAQKYMPVASKRQTYSQAPDRPAGYRGVDYERVGNNASGYSTKYIMNKEIA
jgi:hypothetical protein